MQCRNTRRYKTKTREFDPGSGLTLAAHIRHASRTEVVTNRVKDLSGTKNVTMALVADW